MKKLILFLSTLFILSSFVFAKDKILIACYNDETVNFIKEFQSANPDFSYNIEINKIPYGDNDYNNYIQNAFDTNKKLPDIFVLEYIDLAQQFITGKYSDFVMPYKDLGIDVDKAIEEAQLSPYVVSIGTNKEKEIVCLSYRSDAGFFIYKDSIARKVFGTDKPEDIQKIIGGLSGDMKNFVKAAKKCGAQGYRIAASLEDLFLVYNNSKVPVILDDKFYLSGNLLQFLDDVKVLSDSGSIDLNVPQWSDDWFNGVKSEEAFSSQEYNNNPGKVFAYFGPLWLVNSIKYMENDFDKERNNWYICNTPNGYMWGGTCFFINKNVKESKLEGIKKLIEFFTLDISKSGANYLFANSYSDKLTPASNVILQNVDYTNDFIKQYDISEYLLEANNNFDKDFHMISDNAERKLYLEVVRKYARGEYSKQEALEDFKNRLKSDFGYELIVQE